jgi:AcrR family transcriptional regulator
VTTWAHPDGSGMASVTRVKEPAIPGTAERTGTVGEGAPRTARMEQTRTLILETALRLFRERGYDRTTMRAIAQEAGVSVGNAYYYFASKEHLVQGFYDRMYDLHREAAVPVLAAEREFGARLRGVLLAWLEVAEPYQQFAAQFFKNAADPASPLSPFSAESRAARDGTVVLYRDVLDGSTARPDPELAAQLPELLWLYQMGVVLFWVYDSSPGCARSRMLVERTVPLIDRLVATSRLRVLRPVVRDVGRLLTDLAMERQDQAPRG